MKLPWRKIAAAGGLACVATIGVVEMRRWTAPETAPESGAPIVVLEGGAPDAPWKSATELDDETAGIDPDAMLPAKLQLIGHARADIEFASAPVPQTKQDDKELRNPNREELLLHIARNARKRKDYEEAAKFYRRTLELAGDRADVHDEYGELLAEAGKTDELKAHLDRTEKAAPAGSAAERNRLEELKKRQSEKSARGPTISVPPPPPPPPTMTKKTVKSDAKPRDAPPPISKRTSATTAKPASSSKTPDSSFSDDLLAPAPMPPNAFGGSHAESNAAPRPEPLEEPKGFRPPSMQDLENAVAADPNDALAKLGLARLKLENWRCGEAGDLLADASPKLQNEREYRLTVAWRHAILGEYHDAKRLLERLLDEAPSDPCSTMALADLYFLAKDYQRALGEYGKISEGFPESNEAMLGAAHVLMELERYEDAFLVVNRRASAEPNNAEAVVLLNETLRRMGKLDEAIARLKRTIASLPENHPAIPPLRLQLAKLLLHKGMPLEARCEFEKVALSSFGNHPIVVWGLWAFPAKGDKKERPPAPPVPPEDVNFAVAVSDFLVQLRQYHEAVNLLEQASAASPSDVLLLLKLGDARSHLRTGTGRYSAMDAYMRALTLSPNNCHAMHGYAKAARHAGLLQEALDAADRLICLDANDIPARLEKARTLYAMHRYGEADAVYAQAAGTPVEEQLRRELGRIAETLPPEKQQALTPALTADSRHVRDVMNAIAQQDETLHDELVRLSSDFDAAHAMRSGFVQERSVKSYTDWAPIRGIDAGVRRLDSQPLDDEAAYDLGRNYSRLHSTREALRYYRRVLSASPNHYAAGVAADRLDLEHGHKGTLDGDYFRQRGRDGLTEIDRLRLQSWFALNLGDEDEYIAAGYGFLRYDPTDDAVLNGTVASVRAQYKPFDLLLVHGQLNGETYDDRIDDRLTYDLGAAWRASDCLRVYGSTFKNNVVENGESIRQDVWRWGVTGGVDYSPNRCDDYGGWYRWSDYSDDNVLQEYFAYASHRFSLWPDEVKVIGDFHYWDYENGTVFPLVAPIGAPALLGTVHPYFAPGGYGVFSGHLEWTKALSGDTFKEADLVWIGLRGGGGVDTDGVPFLFGRAAFHRDVCYWLSFHTELGATESRVYRDLSAYAYLTARLRKCAKTWWASASTR